MTHINPTIEISLGSVDPMNAASWREYAESMRRNYFPIGATVIEALANALEERNREHFIINYADYASLNLWDSGIELEWLGNPTNTPRDAWYEITNPEELGLTSYKPAIVFEEGDAIHYTDLREGMEVEVTETWAGGARNRVTRGEVTEIREAGTTPKVGGFRVQLGKQSDVTVEITYLGQAA